MTSRTRKAVVGIVVAVLTVLAAGLLTGTPSQAAGRKLLLGETTHGPWLDNLPDGLFDGEVIAPGAVSETFWVYNNSPQPARVTLDGQVLGDNPFADSLSIESNVGGTVATTPVGRSGRCKNYVTGPSFDGHTAQKVVVTLHFDDDLQADQASTMNQAAGLEFLVTLSQTGAKGKVTVCEPDPSTNTTAVAACASPDTSVVAVIGRSSAPASCTQASLTTAMWSLD